MANRTTRRMTMNEAGMYIAYISRGKHEGQFPVSMTPAEQGQQVLVKGYSTEAQKSGVYNSADHMWQTINDIDNPKIAKPFFHTRKWVASMVAKGYETEEMTVWYTTIITTEEQLAKWDDANSFDGLPCLYWP